MKARRSRWSIAVPTVPASVPTPAPGSRTASVRCWGRKDSRSGLGPADSSRSRTLARDEEVAAAVTTDFLKRPTVAAKVPAQDKARVVEEFTREEGAAVTAVTALLRRPDVAFKAGSDDTARHQSASPVRVTFPATAGP